MLQTFNDAEVDGLRFTIPANIAPRYGALPSGLSAGDASSAVTARTMNISVQISMSSSIKSVQVCPPDLPSFLYTYHYFPVTIPSNLRVSWWALHGHPRQRPTACARHTRPDHHRAPQGFHPPHQVRQPLLSSCTARGAPHHPQLKGPHGHPRSKIRPPKKCKARGCIHR